MESITLHLAMLTLHYHKACDNELSTLKIHIFSFHWGQILGIIQQFPCIRPRIGDTEFDNEVSTWGLSSDLMTNYIPYLFEITSY